MAIKLSKALRNHLLGYGSVKNALYGGKISIYTGSAPANADAAPTGTLLVTITSASGAHTAETQSVGTVTLTGGASGSINTITVNSINIIPNGAVPFNVSLNQTAQDLASAINNGQNWPDYKATASGAIVSIVPAQLNAGTTPNALTVSGTLTTITATYGNMAGGVSSANGLRLASPAVGIIAKDTTQDWTGVASSTGTAGYFRFYGPLADSGGVDTNETQVRFQGDVGTSGAALNLLSTSIVSGTTVTVTNFQLTWPAD